MQTTNVALKFRLAALALTAGTLITTGCGVSLTSSSAPVAVTGSGIQGSVFGGQQPVTGASVQLYAASSSGYGSGSYALLTSAVTTSGTGSFSISGTYTCPSASTPVYIVASGGNPGLGGNNPNIALMAALGPCGNLSSATFVSINELTTIAGVYALSPFMGGYTKVGTSSTNAAGLTNAFATANKLANTSTGNAPGTALPSGATAPTSELNTLGNILAACVNSAGGVAGDGSACGNLFTATTPSGGTAPTDTIGAALNIAKYPASNVSTLIALSSATAPFQPSLSSTNDFTVSIKYTGGSFNTPAASAIDASGNLWVANSGNNTLTVLGPNGSPLVGSPYSGGGLNAPSAIAIDASGNAWVTDQGSSKLSVFTPIGAGAQTTASGLSTPTAVSIDTFGTVWVTNSGNNTVTANTTTGTTVNTSNSFSAGGVNTPLAIAINPK